MPATIPSHQAAVLPLKLRFPDRFDGVALVVGSAAPDIGYTLAGIAEPPSHAWHSLVWFHLPVVVALSWVLRRAAPVVAAHLPGAMRDYGVLGSVRHPVWVTAWSAVLGALTHQVWDAVTHPYMLFVGTSAHLPVMHETALAGLPWWRIAHLASEVVGVLVVAVALVHIGRRRLLARWHGPAPSTPARPFVFWPTATVSAVALGAASLALPGNDIGIWVVGSRWLGAVVLGLLVAAAAVRAATPGPTSLGSTASAPTSVDETSLGPTSLGPTALGSTALGSASVDETALGPTSMGPTAPAGA